MAGFGRYGPFIQHDGKYASLGDPSRRSSRSASIARWSLLAEKAAAVRARTARRRSVIKELGEHPEPAARCRS